jgi:hypothetical protein
MRMTGSITEVAERRNHIVRASPKHKGARQVLAANLESVPPHSDHGQSPDLDRIYRPLPAHSGGVSYTHSYSF